MSRFGDENVYKPAHKNGGSKPPPYGHIEKGGLKTRPYDVFIGYT